MVMVWFSRGYPEHKTQKARWPLMVNLCGEHKFATERFGYLCCGNLCDYFSPLATVYTCYVKCSSCNRLCCKTEFRGFQILAE